MGIFCGKNKKQTKTIILKRRKQEFIIDNIKSDLEIPIATYFRSFSAPVEWKQILFVEKLLILEYETDFFTIFDTIKAIQNHYY